MALVDCNYKFLAIDVGFQGTISNRGVFKKSAMHHAMENNPLSPPPPPVSTPIIFIERCILQRRRADTPTICNCWQ